MELLLIRDKGKPEDNFTTGSITIDGHFQCYTLEDKRREVKVMHETCIPEGVRTIKLRTFGGHHEKYKLKFPGMHKGMLWLIDVPGFKDILIHIGNYIKDTSGCILVGQWVNRKTGVLSGSTNAYIALYEKVAAALLKGEEVTILIQ